MLRFYRSDFAVIVLSGLLVIVLMACAETRDMSEFTLEEQSEIDSLYAKIAACSRHYLPKVDDLITDEEEVAIQVSLRCSEEYLNAYKYIALAMRLPPEENSDFMADAATTESKLRTFVPLVKRYRSAIK